MPACRITREKARARYRAYLRTEEWLVLRQAAFDRDGNRCRLCNSAGPLHAHHRRYPGWGRRTLVADLTSLCDECHEAFHGVWRRRLLRLLTALALGFVLGLFAHQV